MSHPLFSKLRVEELEQRLVLSISGTGTPNLTPPQTAYENLVVANVVGENIFYNDSTFDGNDPTANAADDAAIATNKTALLPGQTATFANYTSYSRGINGIMVDIAGLPGNVTASDFVFMVGNNNTPTTWTQLTVAPTVTIRWGAGVQGSDRVELTWANNTIENEWLQVTVLADADTGLSANTVFYYGNAIGETGNSATDAQVTVADENGAQSHETSHATITNVYDFNRDGQVYTGDISILAANLTTSATALNLISVPAAATTTPFATVQPDFMESSGEYYYFFAPVIVETSDGTLISVAEARTSIYDAAVEGIAETTSTDGGQTWSPISIIAHAPDYPNHYLGMGSLVVDQTTGSVFFVYTVDNAQVLLMSTSDDGQTWTTPQDITSSVMNPAWGYFATGPGSGIQLTIGPDAGRLLIAFDYRYAAGTLDSNNPSYDGVIYSDDNGATWKFGGGPTQLDAANVGVNEATIVQLSSGAIYMNSRLKFAANDAPARGYSISTDGGITWSDVQYDYSLPVSSVEGSIISLDPNTLVFAAPDDPDNSGVRQQMTIWASFDDGQTWTKEQTVNYEFASYSGMVALGHDSGLLEFNVGNAPGADETPKIELVKFNLAGLLNQQPAQFTWNFNEQPIGQAAPIGSSSIRDDGPLDQRGTVQSSGGVPYYVPGSNGDEALRIVNGSNVLLSPATTDGLQFGNGQSFTFQFVLRTTQANGVLLGEMPGDPGYTFSLVNGAITLNLNDGTTSETLTGTTIDDGAWHTVVGIRNTTTNTVSLYVDGALVSQMQDTTGSLQNADDVTLGSYADGSSQLTFDIDLLQVTRSALTPSQFLTSSYVPPQTLPAPTTPANNVLNLPGLGFFLPPYDDRHYFSDPNESDPLLIQPTPGTAARSALDATGQYDVQGLGGATTYFENGPGIGSYWSSQGGVGWTVVNSNASQSPNANFDFVQNTETFTVSDIFNVPSVPSDGSLQLVGNNSDTSAMPGFDLTVDSSGNLDFNITNGDGSGGSLIDQDLATYSSGNSSLPQLTTNGWYQIVIVGNGAGTPLRYYLTPMTATQVQQYQTSTTMTPIATATATGATQNLQIADVSDGFMSAGTSTLNFKDLAIFNQALTAGQVQQLFMDEANPVGVAPSGTTNMFTIGGSAVAVDSGVTVSIQDANLTGASITINNYQSGDSLHYTPIDGIAIAGNSLGMLTLTGSATPTQYTAALQSVTFSTTGATDPRSLSIVAIDGTLDSNPAAESVNVSIADLTASGTTNMFTLGGAAVAIDSGVTIASYQTGLTGATVTIGNFQSGDSLNFANQNGIVGSYSAGVLTLSGGATLAQYQAALQSVTFSTTSANLTTRSLSIAANDGTLDSDVIAEGIDVAIPPPVVTTSGSSGQTYTLGGLAVAVDSGVTVSTYDTEITGASILIANYQSGDLLNFTNCIGISGSYSGGLLTLTGSATPAQYTAALQSVTFSTTGATRARSLSIVAIDGTLDSNPAVESVNVSIAAPIVTTSGNGGQTYTLGYSAVAVDSGVTVSSFDTEITGASLQIVNYQWGDSLDFTNGSGISGTYSSGLLTLTGSATPAQYTAALQSVTFSTTSPDITTRSLSIVAIDGLLASTPAVESTNVSIGPDQVPHSFTRTDIDGADPYAGLTLVGSTLFGTTNRDGTDDDGTIFSMNTDGSGYQVLYSFTGTGTDGGDPFAGLTLVGDTLFGTTGYGGTDGDGTIFSINTDGSGYQVLYSFTGTGNDGAGPYAGLTLAGNTLFGTTAYGGTDGDGTVFSINTDGSGYQVLYSFTGTGNDGAGPYAGLTLAGNTLFGTTYGGGSNGDGTVFSINTDGNEYQILYSFTDTGTDGANPNAGLTLAGNTLFGTTYGGGSNGDGTVFSMNSDGNGYQVLYSFMGTDTDGANPNADLTLVGNTLFGTTLGGGSDGTVFSINTDGSGYQVLYSFTGNGTDGSDPTAGLTLVGNALFGTTGYGGTDGDGTVFSINTDGNDYQVFYSFLGTGAASTDPYADLTLVGNALFGTTHGGGSDDDGTIFSMNPDGSDYQVLYSFTGTGIDGANPYADLTLVGNTLFGTTAYGGTEDDGTVFSINTDGSGYQVLYSFSGTGIDGANSYAGLTLVGNSLFGTTGYGGTDGNGTIFSMNLDGSGYQVLYSFTGTGDDGADPYAGLTLVGNTLFGTTVYGGTDGDGTVFSINTDGSDYQVLYSFTATGDDGADPNAGLTLVGNTLFGTTGYGGADSFGTVFSINTDGSGYQVLYSFTGTGDDGADPNAGLTLVGSTLFGTTGYGGPENDGTVFSIHTDGSDYQVLYSFTGTDLDGANPYAGLTLVGNALFGTTGYGGADGDGTVFSISGATPIATVTPTGSPAHYAAGASAVYVDPGITAYSSEPSLNGATVTISPGMLQTGDILSFTSPIGSGIGGTYAGGVLTLSGNATSEQYTAALQSVTFSSTSVTSGTRSISIVTIDNNLDSNTALESVNLSIAAPVVAANQASVNGTAGQTVAVDSIMTVSSFDSDVTGAVVSISGNFQTGDVLHFTTQNGITVTSNIGGVLTLTGSATPAEYQAALRSITYSSTSTSTLTRTVSYVVKDANDTGNLNSNTATTKIIVSAPVVISQLYVNGSTWSIFDTYLGSHGLGSATLGYVLQTGASQTKSLPWSTINRIDIQFSGALGATPAASSFKITGGTGGGGHAAPAPTVTSVTSLGGNAYQLTLGGPLGYNDFVISIASTGTAFGPAVTDANGAGISGSWTTGSSTFPSGNGLAGSQFNFMIDVLPGDTTQNGTINTQDSAKVALLLNDKTTGATSANYSPFVDVNASGTINTQDSAVIATNLNLKSSNITNPSNPSAGLVGSGFTALALGVQESGQTSSSTSLTTGSSTVPATSETTPTVTTPPATTSTESESAGYSNRPASITNKGDHSRHSFEGLGQLSRAATDAAVSDFDLTDLWA